MNDQKIVNKSILKCICCGEKKWCHIPNTNGGDYVHCSNCGYYIQITDNLTLKNKQFEEEQKKYYDENSICLTPLLVSLQDKSTKKRIDILQKFLPHGKLLEVGPGSGKVLSRAISLGYDVEAVEHSKILATKIKSQLDIPVRIGEFENQLFDSPSYDAYMSFHVIEHVADVISHLKKANSIVKEGGYAFIATPNTGSWEHKLSFTLSPNYSTAHFQLFSKKSLTLCLEKTGWKVIDIITPEYASSWLRVVTAILRKIKVKGKWKSTSRGEYMKSSSSSIGRFVQLFSVISAPFRFIQESMLSGNELFIVAIKSSDK